MPLKKVFCVHCGRSTFVEFGAWHDPVTEPAQSQPQDGGGYVTSPLVVEDWKTAFIRLDAHWHDLQIVADRLREDVKREQNLNRAYQENTQKLRQELNDEIARRQLAIKDYETTVSYLKDERKRKEQVMATCEGLRRNMHMLERELDHDIKRGLKSKSEMLQPDIDQQAKIREHLRCAKADSETIHELRTSLASAKHEISELNRELECRMQMLRVAESNGFVLQGKPQTATDPPKSKDAETIYDLRIELSYAQWQLTKIRSIANEPRKQP